MGATIEIKVPDIGDFKDVPVIDILVKAGDTVAAEQSLITLESDKATVDVPTPLAGTVKELKVNLGDKLSEGSLVLLLEPGEGAAKTPAPPAPAEVAAPQAVKTPPPKQPVPQTAPAVAAPAAIPAAAASGPSGLKPHASPSVRALARELGVNLALLTGNGPKGRITADDVKGYVKRTLSSAAAAVPATAGGGLDLLPWPKIDFSKFGPVEAQPLSRIQKLSGANLARNWVLIPHVTQFDAADITELEAFRMESNKLTSQSPGRPRIDLAPTGGGSDQKSEPGAQPTEAGGAKLTMLAFLIKASVLMLKQFPNFNASLDGDTLVLKRYYHIGFAADTPQGLVVPVIRDADRKSVFEIAGEAAALAKKARDGKLSGAEMQGGCFSISSLGGIGGTSFTPIINAPEVAILGVSKSEMQPRWNGREFVPRLMLPLSLSYDHRVIDGAAAARFCKKLAALLAETGKLLA
ncbi:Dihydrolipoyllysine-residue acetyltransferase component of pyruvate dehydrogenase complex [Georgfuchsia toluolica]|uniref:Dihydrolipoamide acetyltransferase component of pyruvate dehydrogenase complex n=1 Tax=Georgfuchsia toluolica TaxID=424218 RepID=A0A916N344_9PROT|nr:dihydrolipoyllysine-residue acetyltransferase [Georgfuchsia toluolica]CAG4884589.1 Dihydrolipoyllysine-residue acetyltransferase component of pyruvate dehydrogenase complex [Georgfuchsia toluolica]